MEKKMKNAKPKIIFNQTKKEILDKQPTSDDIFVAEYVANLANVCYDCLEMNLLENYKEEEEERRKIILTPEVLAATMQIAYQERYKLRDGESILIRHLTDEEYNEIP